MATKEFIKPDGINDAEEAQMAFGFDGGGVQDREISK